MLSNNAHGRLGRKCSVNRGSNEQTLTFIETVSAEVRGDMISPKAANMLGCLLNVRLLFADPEGSATTIGAIGSSGPSLLARALLLSISTGARSNSEVSERNWG